jgi:hypothetical protein
MGKPNSLPRISWSAMSFRSLEEYSGESRARSSCSRSATEHSSVVLHIPPQTRDLRHQSTVLAGPVPLQLRHREAGSPRDHEDPFHHRAE